MTQHVAPTEKYEKIMEKEQVNYDFSLDMSDVLL